MLHGEIKVNDHVLLAWTAANLGYKDENGDTMYEVTVDTDLNGGYAEHACWQMPHPGGGARGIVAKILTDCHLYLNITTTKE